MAINAFHDSDANITFLGQNFPPPSWQLMLFMTQMQILLSLVKISPPLLAINAFHDSNANITFLGQNFSPLLATNAFHDSDANITFLGQNFPPPSWQLMLFMTQMQILLSLVKNFPPPLGN